MQRERVKTREDQGEWSRHVTICRYASEYLQICEHIYKEYIQGVYYAKFPPPLFLFFALSLSLTLYIEASHYVQKRSPLPSPFFCLSLFFSFCLSRQVTIYRKVLKKKNPPKQTKNTISFIHMQESFFLNP